ncbi:MAG: hypothetical protein HQL36_01855, partial [Alphaproteobacteria bacterium]|nr:hypothetical protein [Alphaproteobacteria bacterium]
FLMQESRFVKLMEGAYDHGNQATGQRSGAMNAAFDRMEAENRQRAEGGLP